MACSMTGYGRAEREEGGRKFTVELKSVNNRYLDISIRMPRIFNSFESQIRTELKQYMERGKVDVFIGFEDAEGEGSRVLYNRSLARDYLDHIREIAEEFSLPVTMTAEKLSQYPDVLTIEEEETDESALWGPLQETIDAAAEQFRAARRREGEFLKNDLLGKLSGMEKDVVFLTERAPETVAAYQKELTAKVQELLGDAQMDESRILQEVAVYSDKVCIDEELVRLRSHIEATRQELEKQGSIGRKLDFLAQELNREANTILSKTIDADSSNRAIGLKTEIEKIREQIQNIE